MCVLHVYHYTGVCVNTNVTLADTQADWRQRNALVICVLCVCIITRVCVVTNASVCDAQEEWQQ